MTPVLLFAAAFVAMEGVSYAGHRWVMHGPGMGWHRSHHAPPSTDITSELVGTYCHSPFHVPSNPTRAVAVDQSAVALPPPVRLR